MQCMSNSFINYKYNVLICWYFSMLSLFSNHQNHKYTAICLEFNTIPFFQRKKNVFIKLLKNSKQLTTAITVGEWIDWKKHNHLKFTPNRKNFLPGKSLRVMIRGKFCTQSFLNDFIWMMIRNIVINSMRKFTLITFDSFEIPLFFFS